MATNKDFKVKNGVLTGGDITASGASNTTITAITTATTGVAGLSVLADTATQFAMFRQWGSAATNSNFGITLGGWATLYTPLGATTTNGLIIGTSNASPIVFGTSAAERMRITPNGSVFIGTTSPLNTNIFGVLAPTSTNAIIAQVTTNTNSLFQGFNSGGGLVFQVTGNADLYSSGTIAIGNSAIQRGAKLFVNTTNQALSATLANVYVNTSNTQAIDVGGSMAFGGKTDNAGAVDAPFAYIAGRKENGTTGDFAGYFQIGVTQGSAATIEAMRVTSAGSLLIGTTAVRQVGDTTPALLVESSTTPGISIVRNTNTSGPAYLLLGKSRGTAAGAVTAVASGDTLGSVEFAGADGTSMAVASAAMYTLAAEAFTTTAHGGHLVFSTTPTGSTTFAERLRITSAGDVQPGSNATATLGTSALRWNTVYASALSDGTASTSSLIGSTSTTVQHALGSGWTTQTFYTGGTERMRIASDGTVTIPGIISSNSGIFNQWTGGNQVIQSATNSLANAMGFWVGGAQQLYSTGTMTILVGATAVSNSFPTGGTNIAKFDTTGFTVQSVTASNPVLTISKNDSGTANQSGGALYIINKHAANTARTGSTLAGQIVWQFSQPTSGSPQNAAAISVYSDGSQAGLKTPSYMSFLTTDSTDGGNTLERMRIDSAGNLGIGGTSPAGVRSTFTVTNTETYDGATNMSANLYFVKGIVASINNSMGATAKAGKAALLDFSVNDNTGGDGAYIGAVGQSTTNSGAHLVFGRRTGISTWAETMRLDASGNLLLGRTTSSGLGLFQVSGDADVSGVGSGATRSRVRTVAAAAAVSLWQNATTGTTNVDGFEIGMSADGLTASIWNYENGPIQIATNSVVRMSITAAGVIQDGAGNELGFKNIPPVSNTWVRGKANVITAGATVGTASAGDVYSVYNDSAVAVTLTQSGITLRLGGTATTGNRTLLPYGFATIWYQSSTVAVINGNVT